MTALRGFSHGRGIGAIGWWLLLVVLLVACETTSFPATESPQTPASPRSDLSARAQENASPPSPASAAVPDVAGQLGDAPSGCPGPNPKPRAVSKLYGRLVGEDVAWAGFYARLEAPDAFHVRDAPRTESGYRVKVLWVMTAAQADPVSVKGQGTSGEDLWFEIEGELPSTEGLLDPAMAGTSASPDWNELPSYLYFPRAGCYTMDVRWPGGSWTIGFGLGR
jgi:hypothetical protein